MFIPARGARTADPLNQIRVGDVVEAHQVNGLNVYRGEVDAVAPHLQIFWILHGSLKERKLFHTAEYEVRKMPKKTRRFGNDKLFLAS